MNKLREGQPVKDVPIPTSHRLIARYARAPNHPSKLRVLRYICQLLRIDGILASTQHGLMRLNATDFVKARLLIDGVFEPRTTALIESLLNEGDCFVDVGANIGSFSLSAARKVGPTGKVLAIEPFPENCADLLENRRLNALQDVIEVASMAVNDVDAFLQFSVPDATNRGMSREVHDLEIKSDIYRVKGVLLRELIQNAGLPHVDAMKMDVEGSELRVLRGLFGSSEAFPPPSHIIFEFLPDDFDYGATPDVLLQFLADHGYRLATVEGSNYERGDVIPENNLWASHSSAIAPSSKRVR